MDTGDGGRWSRTPRPIGYATPLLSTVLRLPTGTAATTTILIGIALVLVCSMGYSSPNTPSVAPEPP